MVIDRDKTTETKAKTFRGFSLRVVEARAADGDTIIDSTLIGPEPDSPMRTKARRLRFVRCRFIRCAPPADAECDEECTYDQRPAPIDIPPDDPIDVDRAELIEILTDARNGRARDVSGFCRKHNLTLEPRR